MNPEIITNDVQLHDRIMKLSYLKEEQELLIKRNVRELGYSLHPAMMIRNFLGKITEDKETTDGLKAAGLNLAKDFLLVKLFGKGQTLKGFLVSTIINKVAGYFINKNPDLVRDGLNKLENFIKDRRKTAELEEDFY